MNSNEKFVPLARALRDAVLILVAVLAPLAHAVPPTFWTGPNINYAQANDTSDPDLLVPGAVSIKRVYQTLLFNPAAGESGPGVASPTDTEWATATAGTLADLTTATNLTYVTFVTWSSGPPYTNPGAR